VIISLLLFAVNIIAIVLLARFLLSKCPGPNQSINIVCNLIEDFTNNTITNPYFKIYCEKYNLSHIFLYTSNNYNLYNTYKKIKNIDMIYCNISNVFILNDIDDINVKPFIDKCETNNKSCLLWHVILILMASLIIPVLSLCIYFVFKLIYVR